MTRHSPGRRITRYVARHFREEVNLRDGRHVVLRPIDPTDAKLLIDLHGRLSPESQYFRFFGPKPRLSRTAAEYLAGVDFQHRFAIVAVADEEGAERIVGVGRFDLRDEVSAEFALVVRDDYQGLGLGTALLARLLDLARARGVRLMTGDVRAENRRMLRLLTSQGFRIGKLDHGAVPVSAPIDDPLSVLSVFGILARRRQLRRGCSSPPSGPRGCALTRPGRWTWRRS